MKLYDEGTWALNTIFQYKGSVIYKGVAWGFPCGLLTLGLQAWFKHMSMGPYSGADDLDEVMNDWRSVVQTYSVAVSFLLVFRTQTAYSRFWDAISCLQQIRGTWVNCVSSCLAFCSKQEDLAEDALNFKHHIVRLMSLLTSSALASVAQGEEHYQALDMSGMDESALIWLAAQDDQCEIILQWIQRLIIENHHSGVLDAPPPILSRVFQELGAGITHLNNARRIELVPFPFPYAQMISLILVLHVGFTIMTAAYNTRNPAAAFCVSFMSSFVFWSVNYIAIEIERPYGEDSNDLPLDELARTINGALENLLQEKAQTPPSYCRDFTESAELVICKVTHKTTKPTELPCGTTSFSIKHMGRHADSAEPHAARHLQESPANNIHITHSPGEHGHHHDSVSSSLGGQKINGETKHDLHGHHPAASSNGHSRLNDGGESLPSPNCLSDLDSYMQSFSSGGSGNLQKTTAQSAPKGNRRSVTFKTESSSNDLGKTPSTGSFDGLSRTGTAEMPLQTTIWHTEVSSAQMAQQPLEAMQQMPGADDGRYGPLGTPGWGRPMPLEEMAGDSTREPKQPQRAIQPALIGVDTASIKARAFGIR
eukprot:TRINITY_DN12600_c0_g1_i1.p1 TRINITY_DN12600_c0_g1~~TRINITY_DN12600_c0_g1_i1.p1  ORF type:complete len:595 (-),score=86.81 TRINITY_DN12600_c0_g1_i1:385-2169(-)